MQAAVKTLITLTVLAVLWFVLAYLTIPLAMYDTNFETFHDALSPAQREGIYGSAAATVRAAAVPPLLVSIAWSVVGFYILRCPLHRSTPGNDNPSDS
jgi:hypothetical protein